MIRKATNVTTSGATSATPAIKLRFSVSESPIGVPSSGKKKA
jgi:hypothetical protein